MLFWMLDTESPRAAWPKAPRTAGEKSSKFLTREDATCNRDRTESGEQRREILDPTAFGGLLNPWISGSGFHAEGCGGTISSTENCEVMKTQPDTTTKTRDDLEECDKRGHRSWASAPPGFVQVSGFPGAHLQFLRCQGGGSSLSRRSLGPWAALPEPLGHAQSLLPAQVPHCRGAQGANKSVWEAAGRGKERLPVREWLHQTFPLFQRVLFSRHVSPDSF